jgi:hypothetical protein
MKSETLVGSQPRQSRKRGPSPKRRLKEFEAAYLRLRMGVKSTGFSALAESTGLSPSQLKNVLGRVRGMAEERRRRMLEALVSPVHDNSPTLSPTQLTWYERIFYAPLLSSGAAAPPTPPAAHVAFDKILLTAKLAYRERLCSHLPLFDAEPGTKSAHFFLSTPHGPVRAFWERSKADYIEPWKRYLRFWRTLNLNAFVEGHWCTIAKLSIEPFRKRCKEHTGKRGPHLNVPCDCEEHGERCPAEHFEYDRPDNYGCLECASLTRSQPNVRFEVTGLGCQLGLHTSLGPSLFAPFVDRETITVAELHIAVDISAPADCLLPFQRKLDGNRGFRTVVGHTNDLDSIGLSWGSSSCEFAVSFYDKSRQVSDFKHKVLQTVAILPDHASDTQPTTRIEFRFRPVRSDLDPTPEGVLSDKLLDLIDTFLVADLRLLEGATPLAELLCRARQLGFIARQPKFKLPIVWRAPVSSDDLRKIHFGPWLIARLHDAGMHRKTVEKAAPILHDAVYAELIRLSEQSGIDLRAIVEESIPRLRAELNACVGIESELGSQSLFDMPGCAA